MLKKYLTVCPYCSLHCADTRLTLDGHHVAEFAPACPTGQAGYVKDLKQISAGMGLAADAQVLVDISDRIRNAGTRLLILSGDLHQEAVQAAVHLARQTNSSLVCEEDISGSLLSLAMARAGYRTATLAEWRGAIDKVVFAGVQPDSIPPRLAEHIAKGTIERAVHLTSADPVDQIQRMRLSVRTNTSNSTRKGEKPSKAAGGLLLFDRTWLANGMFAAVELLRWLQDMNIDQRWYAVYLPPASNSVGVVESLIAATGYPGNSSFSGMQAHYDPRTQTARKRLLGEPADICLLIGDPVGLTDTTRAALTRHNTILLSPQPTAWQPGMWIPIAKAGIDTRGEMTRLDGVPMSIPAITTSQRPKIENILHQISWTLGR